MADRLTVDLAGLDALAKNLDAIRSTLQAGRNDLDSFRGEMGSGDLEGALDSFHSNWRDGRKKIDANAGTVADMATTIAQSIREQDGKLGSALAKDMQGGPKVVSHDAQVTVGGGHAG